MVDFEIDVVISLHNIYLYIRVSKSRLIERRIAILDLKMFLAEIEMRM